MPVLHELAAYLDAQVSDLTLGENLFRGPIPEETETVPALGLVPRRGSRTSETQFGDADLWLEWPRIQVTVRGNVDDRAAADALALLAYKALGRVQAQTLSGTLYHQVRCLMPPYLDRYDGNRRPIVVFDIEPEKEVSVS